MGHLSEKKKISHAALQGDSVFPHFSPAMHLHRASSCGAAARVNGAIIAAGGSLEVGKPQDHLAVFDVVS